MDLGVGSFVFSLGVISALPLLRSTDRRPFLSAVWSSAKRSGGVIALGLVRVIMVKGVDYPVRCNSAPFSFHALRRNFPRNTFQNMVCTGIFSLQWASCQCLALHWSISRLASTSTPWLSSSRSVSDQCLKELAVRHTHQFRSVVHQILLSRTSLQQWTLHAARSSLLSQNKEGLVSLPGERLMKYCFESPTN